MKKITTLLLNILLANAVQAQSPNWHWAKTIGGTSDDFGSSIAIDRTSGDFYTTGSFSGTVDFDPGAGVFNITSAGGLDIFISKFNSLGNFVWVKVFAGTNIEDEGHSIAIDPAGSGDVYTIGTFSDTIDFDPGAGVFNLTGAGLFISKLDSSGNFVWAKAIVGANNSYTGFSIAMDPAGSGDVYTAGSFVGTADFDPGAGVFNLTSAPGSTDIFISKLDVSGNFVWAKAMGGTGPDWANSIAIDPAGNGDVYTTGVFYNTADFDPGAGVFNLIAGGDGDIFISKLNSSGNYVWAKRMGSYNNNYGFSITIDPAGSGAVYTTGTFFSTVDFDPGAGTFNLTAAGGIYQDIFISKLDGSGNFVWAKRIGGTYIDWSSSIAIDPAGSGAIYTIGAFSDTVDFDPGPGTFYLTSVTWNNDIYISKLDSSGNFVWAKAAGGANYDFGQSISIDASGNGYVMGDFTSPSLSFGTITLTNADNTGNSNDIFIARFDTAMVTGINDVSASLKRIGLFPNPFSGSTVISFSLSHSQKVSLSIFDVNGRLVTTLADASFEEGDHETIWNGAGVNAGIYFLQVQSAEFSKTEMLIVTN